MSQAERNVGRINCPFCLSPSKVHKNKSGRLYIHCRHDGPINVHGDSYQDYIEDNMTPYDAEPEPAPVQEPEPAPVRTEPEPDDLQDETPEPEPVQDDDPEQETGWGLF